MDLNQFYFNNKTVQKSNRFKVTILDDERVAIPGVGKMPDIQGYHVVNVSVPNWEFKKETLKLGPYVSTFPVMDFDGFEFSITFEEDTEGTINKFIDWCQRRIMDRNGFYFPPGLTKIRSIIIESYRDNGEINTQVSFNNCFFLKAANVSHDYKDNDSVKIEVTFASDVRQVDFNDHSGESANIGIV